jgi:hypothetical protein
VWGYPSGLPLFKRQWCSGFQTVDPANEELSCWMVLLRDIAWFAVLVASVVLVGHMILRSAFYRAIPAPAYLWLACTTGLLTFSLTVFLLGVFHIFAAGAVVATLIALWGATVFPLRHRRRTLHELGSCAQDLCASGGRVIREAPVLSAATALAAGLAFLGCGAPEVRGDPIIYHITEAWLFVVNRGHVDIPSSALTYIPQNQQMLYALGLCLGSDSLAKLFHWIQGALLVWGTAAAGRYAVGLGRRECVAAALLVAVCPMWFYLATTTYIDLAVGNYLLAALYLLLMEADSVRKGQSFPSSAAASAAGALVGGAVGCKYTAGIVGLIPAAIAWALARTRTRRPGVPSTMRQLALFLAAAMSVFAPWLIRNYLWTGNPVAPSFLGLLGPRGVPPSTLQWPDILAVPAEPVNGFVPLLRAYLQMFFSLSDFGNYLASIALVLGVVGTLSPWRRRFWPWHVRFIIVFLVAAFLLGVPTAALRRDSRYIMAHLALLAVLIMFWYGCLIAVLPHWGTLLRRAGALVLVLLAASGAVQSYLRYLDLNETIWPIWSQAERDRYCAERLSNYYANKNLAQFGIRGKGKVLGAAYPAPVNYVLGGAPLTPDLLVQNVRDLRPEHIQGLRRQGVRYLFGEIAPELQPWVRLLGKSGDVPLWELRDTPAAVP